MKKCFPVLRRLILSCVVAAIVTAAPAQAADKNEQFFPILIYRVGPYAPAGIAINAGYMDYLALINRRDGGINGVKLTWEECETEYKTDLGVACYEKLKGKGPTGATLFAPYSTGMTYALLERVAKDKIPLVTMGYGRTDATDGRVMPYVFPIITNYWSQATAIVRFLALRSGGIERLKGKKIAYVYHDSAYGKEGIAILEFSAKKYGFEVMYVPIKPPGLKQDTEWKDIQRANPDWVILWGFGDMNHVALKAAQQVNFSASRIVGVWWAGAEEDVMPAGDAAKGYSAAAFHLTGDLFPVIQDIRKHVYSNGSKGAIDDAARIGQTYYNRGVVQGIISTEAVRKAQERFGHRPLTGEEVRWGLENLSISDLRIHKIGAFGLIQSLKLSCLDHEGGGAVRFQRWTGSDWTLMSGWIQGDKAEVRSMIEDSAAKYAREKGIVPRDCGAEVAAGGNDKAS
jgi:branched-chain amino acid transport system substrate-binding protein